MPSGERGIVAGPPGTVVFSQNSWVAALPAPFAAVNSKTAEPLEIQALDAFPPLDECLLPPGRRRRSRKPSMRAAAVHDDTKYLPLSAMRSTAD